MAWAQKNVDPADPPAKQRKDVVKGLKKDLKADAVAIKGAIKGDTHFTDVDELISDDKERNSLKKAIRTRIEQGEDQMVNQDLESLAD